MRGCLPVHQLFRCSKIVTFLLLAQIYYYFFLSFCCVALLAAAPEVVTVSLIRDSANVSGTVTSHGKGLPLAQDRRVVPSGRLLFSSIRLTGSFNAGIWACLMALHIMSFMWLWRCCLEALLRQDNPCSSRACTALPHTQVCGSQTLQPSLWATAVLVASSESLRPTEVIGEA